MAAYEALKKKIVVARTGPTATKRHTHQRAHSQCQGLHMGICNNWNLHYQLLFSINDVLIQNLTLTLI